MSHRARRLLSTSFVALGMVVLLGACAEAPHTDEDAAGDHSSEEHAADEHAAGETATHEHTAGESATHENAAGEHATHDYAGEGQEVAEHEGASPGASIRIVEPADGASVNGPDVTVRFVAENLEIVPAGDIAPNSGHHHLIVNADLPPLDRPIPAVGEVYIHMGMGQTEYVLTGLEPGEYRVIGLVGDHIHVPLDPPVADTVTFVVR